jgi:hypothetical protein
MDLSLSQWLDGVNTSVAVCFTSSATLPDSISPSEAMHQLLKGYRESQQEVNAAATAPPYISASAPIIFGQQVLADGTGDYRTVEHRFTIRQYFDPNNAGANLGSTII